MDHIKIIIFGQGDYENPFVACMDRMKCLYFTTELSNLTPYFCLPGTDSFDIDAVEFSDQRVAPQYM